MAGVFTGDSGSGGSSGLVPAPAAGDAAANKFLNASGAWAVTPAGSGGATNLGVSETTTSVSISSSTGSGATIPAATTSAAGVMTAAQVATLNSALQSAPVSSVVGQTGAVTAAQIASTLPAATTTSQGAMTAAQVATLNALQSAPATNLGVSETASTVTITSSTGSSATLPAATSSAAGVMTAAQVTALGNAASSSSLASYAPLASPALAGTPTAPTATTGANSTQIATTAFVQSAVSGVSGGGTPSSTTPLMDGTAAVGTSTNYARGDHVHPTDTSRAAASALTSYAPLASPALSGTPTAPTATTGTSSTQLATTAFVQTAISGVTSGGSWSDNYTVGSEILSNNTFASNLSGWTVTGDFVWNSGGGGYSASSGQLIFAGSNSYAAAGTAIYHCHLVAPTTSGAIRIGLQNAGNVFQQYDEIWTNVSNGAYDFYWASPGASAGVEKLVILNSGGAPCLITSVSLKRMTFTRKALVGGLDLSQGASLVLPSGNVSAPGIVFNDSTYPNADAGINWNTSQQALEFSYNGLTGINFLLDPSGAAHQITGLGTNRLTIQNTAALVLRPANGHMEWEGDSNAIQSTLGVTDFEVVGYGPGSTVGRGIRFRSEAAAGNQPPYILGVHAGGAQSETLPGLVMINHTGTFTGTWYPNGNLSCQTLSGTSITATTSLAAPNVVYNNASVNLTAGYTATADASIGTVASGTVTPSQALGDYHTLTNNGAFTLNPPSLTAPANSASGVIEVYNGASAGTITLTSWTKVNGSFDTTAGHLFQCDYCVTPRGSSLNIRAMQ